MVADQFPMFKLATLLARQLSSPIAARVKTLAKSHPRFGTEVCVRVAELFRRGEWAARAWSLRLAGTRLRPGPRAPLPRQRAIDLGGDLIGEIVIFTMGSLIIIFEVNRQAAIKEVKALDVKSEWLAVKLSLEELQREVALQQQDVDRLHRVLLDLTVSPPSPAPTPHTPSGSSVSHRSNVHPPHIPKVPHSVHKSLIPVTPHNIPDGAHASPVPRLQNKPQNTRKPPQVPPPRVPHAPLDSHTHHSSPRDSRNSHTPHTSHFPHDAHTPQAPH